MSNSGAASSKPYVTTPGHLEKLRTALALNRGIDKLAQIEAEAGTTVEHDEAGRVNYLEQLFIGAHRDMFQDWKEQNAGRPGDIPDPMARQAVRNIILTTLCVNGAQPDSHDPKGLFDSNGFVMRQKPEQVARTLAEFYQKMRNAEPFEYGNELTLDLFMSALGKLPAFKEVYPAGIDLRRLDGADVAAMHTRDSIPALTKAFMHAMDFSRTPHLNNSPNGYGKWEKHVEYVSGIPFLSHEKGDEKFLVTVNGGLVPLKTVQADLEKHLLSDHMIADFPPIRPEQITGYLPGTESLREPGKKEIDGIPVSPDGSALFCLGTNILSGLRGPHHNAVLGLVEQCGGKKTPLFTLANNPDLRDKMIAAARSDAKLRRAVEIAYERVSIITQKLNAEKEAIFAGKTPNAKPAVYMCMGGAGAGKSAVKHLARAECGDNFVEASLDEFRKKSDLYKVLTAAGHHGDDYVAIEPFANTLRTWVANHALNKGKPEKYNVLYDGTGIVYKPRYADVINDFKAEGFRTSVTGVDTALAKMPGRERDYPVPSVARVQDRFVRDKRALPWIVVTGKHTRMPRSFIEAADHKQLDKLSLFANDRGEGNHYLVTESFQLSDEKLREMQSHQRKGSLKNFLEDMAMNAPGGMLAAINKGDRGAMAAMLARNKGFREDNVAFIVYPAPDANRVLAVYNVERFVDTLEKGMMNPHASFEDGLLNKPGTMPFYKAVGRGGDPWKLSLQEPQRVRG